MNEDLILKRKKKKRLLIQFPSAIIWFFIFFLLTTPLFGKGIFFQAELTDKEDNNVQLSASANEKVILTFLFKGSNDRSWRTWAKVETNLVNVISAHLKNKKEDIWNVKLIDGQEIMVKLSGKLSGKAIIAGIPDIPFSIPWEDIKDITFQNSSKPKQIPNPKGLSALFKFQSGKDLKLFKISTRDYHESKYYYGVFSGERVNTIPLMKDKYELEIPISYISKLNFKNNGLIADVVYHHPITKKEIKLVDKIVGYDEYDIAEFQIYGHSWLGAWELRVNRTGHGLLSIENFSQKPKEQKKFSRGKKQGICITSDGKKWQVEEFVNFKVVNIKVGKAEIELPTEKIKKITIEKQKNKHFIDNHIEVILKNGEKITGEGELEVKVLSFSDEYGVQIRIYPDMIKAIEFT